VGVTKCYKNEGFLAGEPRIDTAPKAAWTDRPAWTDSASELVEHELRLGTNESLFYWTLGAPNHADGSPRPTLILLHGMRDVGRSLLPVADAVRDEFFCVMPDLRGHGRSFKPGAYAIQHFLMDLRRLQEALQVERVSLLGHSLGGQVVCRYGGLFPSDIAGLIVIEGLGPPSFPEPAGGRFEREANQLHAAITRAAYANNPRDLSSVTEAAEALCNNNPRLDAQWALQLAQWGTSVAAPDSTAPDTPDCSTTLVRWAFDPRVQEVFLGVNEKINFDYWRSITAPTLVVTGDLGYQYWSTHFPSDGYTGHYGPGELAARLAAIGTTHHVEIADAGHQVHYDQPARLATVTREFLLAHVLPSTSSIPSN